MRKIVLAVEDDLDILNNMVQFLEDEGYEARRATNGREALDYLNRTDELPSVIVLDLMMPVMDGLQFRIEQEKNPRIANIPVILASAVSDIESKRYRLGAVEFIKKPIDIDELSEMLKKY